METLKKSSHRGRLFLHSSNTTNQKTLGSPYHHHPCTPSLFPLMWEPGSATTMICKYLWLFIFSIGEWAVIATLGKVKHVSGYT